VGGRACVLAVTDAGRAAIAEHERGRQAFFDEVLIFGIGLGLNMQSLVLAMQNAVPAKDMGVASAASSFFRSVGGTLGTAIFLSILFSLAGTKITQAYAKAATSPAYLAAAKAHPGQVAALRQHLGGGLDDTAFLNGLAKPLADPFFESGPGPGRRG
jgi:hypothetical protein